MTAFWEVVLRPSAKTGTCLDSQSFTSYKWIQTNERVGRKSNASTLLSTITFTFMNGVVQTGRDSHARDDLGGLRLFPFTVSWAWRAPIDSSAMKRRKEIETSKASQRHLEAPAKQAARVCAPDSAWWACVKWRISSLSTVRTKTRSAPWICIRGRLAHKHGKSAGRQSEEVKSGSDYIFRLRY